MNAGILFYDPSFNIFSFEIGDVKRKANAYPDINYNYLNRFFTTVKDNLKRFESNGYNYFEIGALKEFITKNVFFSDAAGLTFDDVKRIPISENSDSGRTKQYLKELYLVGQCVLQGQRRKRNEELRLL